MNLRVLIRSLGTTLHRLLVLAAIALIAVSGTVLYLLIFEPERAERLTIGVSPRQFFRDLDGDLLDSYAEVFAIAHNAGDSIATTRVALDQGVDVIEIDVVSLDGRLYAAHDSPHRWFSSYVFRGPGLEQIWRETDRAAAVKLDLKESTPRYVDRVVEFIWAYGEGRRVIVASPDPAVLLQFAERLPSVYRLLSVGSDRELEALRADPALVAAIDGVTIRATLLDRETVEWFAEQRLLVMAWTINQLGRVNDLVEWGVDGITTDNLAIAQLLGSEEPGQLRLDRYRSGPEAAEAEAEEEAEAAGEDQSPGQAQLGLPAGDANLDQVVVLGGEPGDERHHHGHDDEADRPAPPSA